MPLPVPVPCPPPAVTPGPAPPGPSAPWSNVEAVVLCDQGTVPPTPFIRHIFYMFAGFPQVLNTTLDPTVGYAPVGPLTPECSPALAIAEHHSLLAGAGTFSTPALGVISVTVHVRTVGAAGSVTVTTADGAFVALAGETYTWSVIRDQDNHLQPVTVTTTNAGDAVLITYAAVV